MKIETDDQLDEAQAKLDVLLRNGKAFEQFTPEERLELDELSDAIYEFEERTDILNRNYRI